MAAAAATAVLAAGTGSERKERRTRRETVRSLEGWNDQSAADDGGIYREQAA